MILSIIVPVYNASKYLHRCVDSLLAQGLFGYEYEIILINDGSKDNSLEICQSYELDYPTIVKVLTHENQGVAFTRNRGIKAAQGEYICFVDSDDYLIPGGYRYLIDNYLDESLDILSFWALTLDKKTKANHHEDYNVNGHICYEIKGRTFLENNVQTFIWNSFYRKDFVDCHQIRFEKMTIGEDVLFNTMLYLKDPLIRMVSSRIYRYEIHEESILNQRDYESIRKAITSYQFLIDSLNSYIEANNNHIGLKRGLYNVIELQFVPFISRILSSDLSIKEFCNIKNRYSCMGILPLRGKTKSSRMINFVFYTPLFVHFYKLIYQRLFLPYIYPNLSRN